MAFTRPTTYKGRTCRAAIEAPVHMPGTVLGLIWSPGRSSKTVGAGAVTGIFSHWINNNLRDISQQPAIYAFRKIFNTCEYSGGGTSQDSCKNRQGSMRRTTIRPGSGSFGVQREIPGGFVLRRTYVGQPCVALDSNQIGPAAPHLAVAQGW